MNGAATALEYHRLTRHGSPTEAGRLVDFIPLDPANRPTPFKRYRGLNAVPLPTEPAGQTVTAADVLSGRSVDPAARPDAGVLARLLYFSAGVTRVAGPPEARSWFRPAMSAGNLQPVEVYVVVEGVAGLEDGVHHFDPLEFTLTPLRTGTGAAGALASASASEATALALVLTGIPWRTEWKYGERGYRHLWWDAGTMLANLLAEADACGLAARVLAGFVDDEVCRLVGIDPRHESPLAVVPLGESLPGDPAPDDAALDPLEPELEPISRHPVRFPLVDEIHTAGSLADRLAVSRWRDEATGVPAATEKPVALPEEIDGRNLDEVILQRGSTRLMRPQVVPGHWLWWGMGVTSLPVPCDFAMNGRTLLQHLLAVHGVEGVDPGAYRWRGDRLDAVTTGDLRDQTRRLCLDQPLGGDSAYTVFHAADLDSIVAGLGARGYRAAQLEAGIAAGRLSLAAFTVGAGATGLTFYDEAVSRFFATDEACMLVTSVGVPDYRNTPGGPPGSAVDLTHLDWIQRRLVQQLAGRG